MTGNYVWNKYGSEIDDKCYETIRQDEIWNRLAMLCPSTSAMVFDSGFPIMVENDTDGDGGDGRSQFLGMMVLVLSHDIATM